MNQAIDQDFWEGLEEGNTPAGTIEAAGSGWWTKGPGLSEQLHASFERREPPPYWDCFGATKPGDAHLVIRLAQYGCGSALRALAVADARAFDQAPHVQETSNGRTSLIAEALWGWAECGHRVGGAAILEGYADAIEALLTGGASRYVVADVSMVTCWPLVLEVKRRTGVRLINWASEKFEAECWRWAENQAWGEECAFAPVLAR